jgi:hypothetical protein
MAGEEDKEFSAKVPYEQWKAFKDHTDSKYGGANWFINTALKIFNEKVSEQPSLRLLVQESIDEMLIERRENKQSEPG